MNDVIANADREYADAVQRLSQFKLWMDDYFRDPELWKSRQRFWDVSVFIYYTDYAQSLPSRDTLYYQPTDTYNYITYSDYLDKVIASRSTVIEALKGQRDRLLEAKRVALEEKLQKQNSAAAILAQASTMTEELKQCYQQLSAVSIDGLGTTFVAVNSRLQHYLRWKAGIDKAQEGWGANYTVTLLHQDLNDFLKAVPTAAPAAGMSAGGDIADALSRQDYGEETLKAKLLVALRYAPVVTGLTQKAENHNQKFLQVRSLLDQAQSITRDLDSEVERIYVAVNQVGTASNYGRADLVAEATTGIKSGADQLKVQVQLPPVTPPPVTPPPVTPPPVTPPVKPPVTPPVEKPISMQVNGHPVASDTPPVIVSSRTLVPVRFVGEALNCTVQWRQDDRTVLITALGKAPATVPLGSGQLRVVVDGREIQGDTPPQLINNRTMVPVRFIAEALGAQVGWDGENRRVVITGSMSGTTGNPPVTPPVSPPVTPTPPPVSGGQGTALVWQEWMVRTVGLNLPLEQDIIRQEDTPWVAQGGSASYSGTGEQMYHNDFVITAQDFDVSDILLTFEATGSFRTRAGYTGPTIAFIPRHKVHNGTQGLGGIGVIGVYSWEYGKQDRGLQLLSYNALNRYEQPFIDFGDNTYRAYSLRVKDNKATLTLPDGTTLSQDIAGLPAGTRLPLVIAMREYDAGAPYSLSIRNLKVVERPR